MLVNGGLLVKGPIAELKIETLVSDPTELTYGRTWVNSTEGKLKWYNGTETRVLAEGADLDNYLSLAGGTLTGELVLAGPATQDLNPSTFKQLNDGLALKQDNLTGAATTIASTDLALTRALVSDESGKVAVSPVTAAELAYMQGVTSAVQTQIDSKQADLGYVPVNKAGDTMSGNLQFDGTATATNMGAPVNPTDAVRLMDIDNLKADLDFQADVEAMQTDGTLDPTATPVEGVRYIVTDTTTLHLNFGTIAGVENGDIVEFDGAEFVVAYDVSVLGAGALVWDRAQAKFMKYNGTAWTEHGGLSGVTASAGLTKSGNTISVKFDSGTTVGGDGGVALDLANNRGLVLVDPTTGEASSAPDAVLATLLTGALESTDTGIRIKASGVDETHIAATALGNGIEGGAGTALTLTLADTSLLLDGTGLKVGDLSATYVPREGDSSVTGQIAVPTPTVSTSITNKQYVDDADTALNDTLTALGSRLEACQVVFDGTVGGPQTSYTVNHLMGNRYVQVTVYDTSFQEIVPDTVTLTDDNNVTVTLEVAQNVYIVVQGLKAAA
jgi:hypothetical protein